MQRNIGDDFSKPGKNTKAITRVALLAAVLAGVLVLGFLVHPHPAQAPFAPPVQPAVAQVAPQGGAVDADQQQGPPSPAAGVARISLLNGDVSVRRGDSGDGKY